MKSNSRINKEEQVQVVIRLKPQDLDHKFQKCAYFSSQTGSLLLETPNKKQYFVFDSIADQNYTQSQMYQLIGREAVQQAIQGYNCCIFAYGQTGAGKTYSILGVLADLISNPLAETRGILPRLLQDLFKSTSKQVDKSTVRISYMEIYNEQIFDLLSPNTKVLQIRQDIKKGVFVDGISQQFVTSYSDSFGLILSGQKNRKIAATAMNCESSRSHTIFTINIDSEVQQNDIKKYRKSKINIVDLAGSQRVKHTNVQGERLRQGCNINKSLHVLSNVINGLVESAKKKKHIPFRDSKLTYFLKDSLGGNSITKLLANIQTNRLYLGDTLSTLMFAKRAKILKTKVEINQNTNQNYDNLRNQIKKLRQELAQARYINQIRVSQRNQTQIDTQYNIQKIDTSNFQSSNYDKPMQVFQQNELHYKALIEIYEQHMQQCSSTLNYFTHQQNTYVNNFKKKPNILTHNQWKKIQKKNQALLNLIRRMPAFTKIFRENIMLKQDRNQDKNNVLYSQQRIKAENHQHNQIKAEVSKAEASKAELQNVVNYYENLIKQIKNKFKECLQSLDKSYLNLQNDIIQKDKAIKQLKKRQAPPPEIEQLIDQNQYLKLNILQLEAQINDLYETQQKQKIKDKEQRRNSSYKEPQLIEQPQNSQTLIENQESKYIQKVGRQLENIKLQAQRQILQLQTERNTMINFIHDLQEILKKQIHTQKKINIDNQSLKLINQQLHSRVQELCQTIKAEFKNDFDTTRYSDFDNMVYEDQGTVKMLEKQIQINKKIRQEMSQIQKKWQLQLQAINIKKNSEVQSLKKQIQGFMKKQQQAEVQFGKSINEILEQYSELLQSKQIMTSRSSKVLSGYKWRQSNLKLQRQSDFKKGAFFSTNKKQEDQKKSQKAQRQRLSSRESQQRKLFVYRSPKK